MNDAGNHPLYKQWLFIVAGLFTKADSALDDVRDSKQLFGFPSFVWEGLGLAVLLKAFIQVMDKLEVPPGSIEQHQIMRFALAECLQGYEAVIQSFETDDKSLIERAYINFERECDVVRNKRSELASLRASLRSSEKDKR